MKEAKMFAQKCTYYIYPQNFEVYASMYDSSQI